MSRQQWVALIIAAVVVFWMVGAYNRLMALRNRLGRAFEQVEHWVGRRSGAVAALAAALREPLASEHGALDALIAADERVRRAVADWRARPVAEPSARALVGAEAEMGSAASRALALVDQQPELAAGEAVAQHLAALRESQTRLAFARQLFNEIAAQYNAAARQFPTRLLARSFGFGSAGSI
jgi:LemA protein